MPAREGMLDVARRHRARGMTDRGFAVNPGGPMPTLEWEAFFGSEADKGELADAAGMNYRTDFRGVGSSTGGSQMPAYAPDPMTARTIGINQALADDTYKHNANRLSLRALSAQARSAENAANEADWATDPSRIRARTGAALEGHGMVKDFERGQRVKDAGNTALEYMASEPTRNYARWNDLRDAREMFPFSKEATSLEEARIGAGAKVREAESNRARERSQALRSLADIAKARTAQPMDIADPTGAREGGVPFFGWGSKPKMIPNPAYDDLSDAMDAAYQVLDIPNPTGGPAGATGAASKVMSQDDLLAFAQQNGMTAADAAALAKSHGWTVR